MPRLDDVLGGRRPGDDRLCRFSEPDGALRGEVTTPAGELAALAALPGRWIDKVHQRRPATRARLTANRKAALTTGISSVPVTTRYSCSTSSAMSNGMR